MLEDETLEQNAGSLFLLAVKAGEGLELEAEVGIGSALALAESELVGGGAQCAGEAAGHVERGLRGAGLVSLELDNATAGKLGKGNLSERALFAQGSKALGKSVCRLVRRRAFLAASIRGGKNRVDRKGRHIVLTIDHNSGLTAETTAAGKRHAWRGSRKKRLSG